MFSFPKNFLLGIPFSHSVVPIHPMGDNIKRMSNSKYHIKSGGSLAFLLQIDE